MTELLVSVGLLFGASLLHGVAGSFEGDCLRSMKYRVSQGQETFHEGFWAANLEEAAPSNRGQLKVGFATEDKMAGGRYPHHSSSPDWIFGKEYLCAVQPGECPGGDVENPLPLSGWRGYRSDDPTANAKYALHAAVHSQGLFAIAEESDIVEVWTSTYRLARWSTGIAVINSITMTDEMVVAYGYGSDAARTSMIQVLRRRACGWHAGDGSRNRLSSKNDTINLLAAMGDPIPTLGYSPKVDMSLFPYVIPEPPS